LIARATETNTGIRVVGIELEPELVEDTKLMVRIIQSNSIFDHTANTQDGDINSEDKKVALATQLVQMQGQLHTITSSVKLIGSLIDRAVVQPTKVSLLRAQSVIATLEEAQIISISATDGLTIHQGYHLDGIFHGGNAPNEQHVNDHFARRGFKNMQAAPPPARQPPPNLRDSVVCLGIALLNHLKRQPRYKDPQMTSKEEVARRLAAPPDMSDDVRQRAVSFMLQGMQNDGLIRGPSAKEGIQLLDPSEDEQKVRTLWGG